MDFLETSWKIIKWCGNIIFKVVSWFFGEIREIVENSVKAFIKSVENKLKKATDFIKTLKVATITKMLDELKKMAKKYYEELTEKDQNLIKELFENELSSP